MSFISLLKTSYRAPLLYAIFFFSGMAALIYQVSWQRILVFYTGTDSSSMILIVSAYMVGLGLGSLGGGYFADRLGDKGRLIFFAVSEALIGIYALGSKYLLYDYLHGFLAESAWNTAQVFILLFALMLLPTFFMGASLPVLVRSFGGDKGDGFSGISKLYFVNTLGAAIGAALPVILVRLMGFTSMIYATSGFNFLCSLLIFFVVKNAQETSISVPSEHKHSVYSQASLWYWSLLYFITGFVGIAFEALWFRMMSVMVKPIYATFPALLAVYIGGLALGSLLTKFVPVGQAAKSRRFFQVQLFIALYVLLSIVLFMWLVNHVPAFHFLFEHFGSYDVNGNWKLLCLLYGVVLPCFILPPTMAMGLSFVLIQGIVQDEKAALGRKLGLVQFMNILGSCLGALFTSIVAYNFFGTSLTFRLIIGFTTLLVLAVFLFKFKAWAVKTRDIVLTSLTFLAVLLVFPSNLEFWSFFHGAPAQDILVKEDADGIAAIRISPKPTVFCQGLGQSEMNYKADDVHVAFGLVPALLHPNPRSIAIIGLGSGSTLYAAGGRKETEKIVCFEIAGTQKELLAQYNQLYPTKVIDRLLTDKRFVFQQADARFELNSSTELYDIIEADALRVNSAFSGNLYSLEYFQLVKSRLKPGGYLVTWVPSDRVYRTVVPLFKYFRLVQNLLIASDSYIPELSVSMEHAREPFTIDYFALSGLNPAAFMELQHYVKQEFPGPVNWDDVNTDLFPKDEFRVP